MIISINEALEILGESVNGMDNEEMREWIVTQDAVAVAALEDAKRRRKEDALALANLIYDLYQESKD